MYSPEPINYVINIEQQLMILDEMFKPLLIEQIQDDGLTFAIGRRYPLLSKIRADGKSIPSNIISNKPYHPWISVAAVSEILINDYIYSVCNLPELYEQNTLIQNSKEFIISARDMEDILGKYLIVNKYTTHLIYEIVSYINNNIWPVFHNVVKKHPDEIIEIDIESQYFVIKILGNIGTYRYFETLKNKEK